MTRVIYDKGGIFAAMSDDSFPVADARFSRKGDHVSYHLRGPVYFNVSRQGELTLSGQKAGVPLTRALRPYVQLGRLRDFQGSKLVDAPTEWFPPPRLLLDSGTAGLFIASISRMVDPDSRTVFVPLEQYVNECARLFVDAFKACG
ncbi:hypothetical protein R5O87_09665 [Arthrobacter globiformis]|uniref:hypothetical protein n=1 Tax=Arthrobacter globiformis TaxID=1665 RepID=UPI00397BFD80